MTQEEKIDGSEPLDSEKNNIKRNALLYFMAAHIKTFRSSPQEAAREAQAYWEKYLAVANEEIFNPGQSVEG